MTTAPDNEERLEAQEAREVDDRMKTLVRLVSYAQRHQLPAVELLEMAQALGLELELDELAVASPERQQRLADLRQQLLELELAGAAHG